MKSFCECIYIYHSKMAERPTILLGLGLRLGLGSGLMVGLGLRTMVGD